jgi:C7-cyclitol 7-kinase
MGPVYACVAVDVGGTHVRFGIGDESGGVHFIRKSIVRNYRDGLGPESVADRLTAQVAAYSRDMTDRLPSGSPLVLAFPGPVAGGRYILAAPTLMGAAEEMPDLYGRLAATTDRPVRILNDVSAAAWYYSAVLDADRILVVTVSSGIGAKLFDRHHALGVLDDRPYAGEIGHQVLDCDADAPRCDCGGRGHLGAMASGRGFERAARRRALVDPEQFAASACVLRFRAEACTLTNEDHLVRAIRDRDRWAMDVVRRGCRPLAQSLLSVVLAVGVERVVVIGGFAQQAGPVFLEILREEMRSGLRNGPLAPDPADLIVLGEPDEEACLRGAAVYAIQQGRVR